MDGVHYKLLKRLLRFGQVLGFPLPEEYGNVPKPRIIRYAAMGYSIFMTIVSFIQVLLTIRSTANVAEEVSLLGSGLRFTYHFSVFALHVHLLISHKSFETLLKNWMCTNWHIKHEGANFSSVVTTVTVLIASAILETSLYDWAVYQRPSDQYTINATFLEKYVDTSLYENDNLQSIKTGWNPILLGIFYVLSKLLTLGTDYSDSLCILLAFGISARIKTMNEYLRLKLYYQKTISNPQIIKDCPIPPTPDKKGPKITWAHIYTDFINLRQLSDAASKFISPLIFVSLMVNVFAVVSYLDNGINLSGRSGRFQSHNASNYISLWHYLLRTVLVIHYASGVSRNSDETLSVLEDAPNAMQSWPDTEPILAMLRRKPIGITFFDTFVITRNIYISILNFVFTIEIMILQASSSGRGKLVN